jgi:hypothetical protein
MLKRVMILTSVVAMAAVIMVVVWRFRGTTATETGVNNNINKVEAGALKNDKSYVLVTSPSGNKKIVCSNKNELVLHVKSGNNETSKVIYENYSLLSSDPYSLYNFQEYNIQWSQNERYIFIKDSIYDIETDKLIKIKSSVFFKWIGNKGIYMDNGYFYSMEFDDGYTNYMVVAKKLNVFDAGDISTLASAGDGKYFVLDNIILESKYNIKDNNLVINTASLKYKAENLQKIINKEYSKMIKAIYKRKKITRFQYPENIIANGKYYLKNITSTKIPLD